MAHWSFGPDLGLRRIAAAAVVAPDSPAASQIAQRVDLIPTLNTADPDVSPGGVSFRFEPYDPAVFQAPAETRVYLTPNGETPPAYADAFVAKGYPYTSSSKAVPATGDPAYLVPHATIDVAPEGEYIARTLLFFPD